MLSDRPARPSEDGYRLDIALAVAARSTCLRRRYGAARGDVDCFDTGVCHRCGHGHDDGDYGPCPAVHAGMNAMPSASRSEMIGATPYLAGVDLETGERVPAGEASPCPVCMRVIGNAGVAVVTGA